MAKRLRALFCDHLNLMRGKYVPVSESDTRFCQSVFGVHYDKDLLPSPGSKMMEGLPDMELKWDGDDVRKSWEKNTKIVVGDLYDTDGAPLGTCGRGALKRAVAAWESQGLTPKIGIELEAFAFTRDGDKWVPYQTPGDFVYGTGPFIDPIGFNNKIWWAAADLGFELEMITSEFDSAQFEYTLKFDDAVKSVDNIALFKLMAREIALKEGVLLTFMPRPIEEAGGSGMHINFSFFDKDGNNAISNGGSGGVAGMTDLAKQCVAGLVHHHKGLAGLLSPTVNSYKRLQPASLSGYWQNWGGDHRNVTTRVSTESGQRARLEHRMCDATANPYTAVAAVLQAALLGVSNGYELGAPESGDGFESNDAETGVAENLAGAIADLEADTALCEAVGNLLTANHIFMKGVEVEKTAEMNDQEQLDFYIHFI